MKIIEQINLVVSDKFSLTSAILSCSVPGRDVHLKLLHGGEILPETHLELRTFRGINSAHKLNHSTFISDNDKVNVMNIR